MKRRFASSDPARHALWLDKRGGASLLIVLMGFRAFVATVIHAPEVGNAFWLAIAAGMLLGCIPGGMCLVMQRLKAAEDSGHWAEKVACLCWGALFLLDGTTTYHVLVSSADFATSSLSHYIVLLGTALCLFFLCLYGIGAMGGAAMIYLRVAAVLAVIVLAVQLPSMHARWLTPVLGGGWPVIWKCGLRLGGVFSLAAALPLGLEDGADKKGTLPLLSIVWSGAIAAAMAAVYAMMTPALTTAPVFQTFRLDTVLSNGRSPLALQFPISLIWFGGLFLALGAEASLGIRALSRLLPRCRAEILCGALTLCMLILGFLGVAAQVRNLERWYYPAICLLMAMGIIWRLIRRRKVKA